MKWKIDNYNGHPLIVNINDIFEGIKKISDEGLEGPPGQDGADGKDGWSPIFAIENDFERRVLKLVDWTGGTGTKPTSSIGKYIGSSGLVIDATNAVDIRGAAGEDGTDGINGADGTDGLSLEFNWDGTSLGVRQEGDTTYEYVDLSAGGGSTFVELTDTPNTLGTDGQILRMESDMYGRVSMKWKDFPTIPQELIDFPEWPYQHTATEGQVLSLSANQSGGNDLVWVDAPSGGGGASVTHGTFTPTMQTTPTSYITQRGHWIRIGDWVRVSVDLAFNHTTLADPIRINLPFNVYNSNYSYTSAGTIAPAARNLPTRTTVDGAVDAVYCFVSNYNNQIWVVDKTRTLMSMSNADNSDVGFVATVEYIIDTA